MEYEATSINGNKVRGELEYDALNMYIIERKPYGTSKIACVPGTETEISDESTKMES